MHWNWTYLEGDARPTLPDLIRRAASQHGDRVFLVLGDQRVTFAQAERTSAHWARGLLALGVQKASRVGILMPNAPDWATTFFAASRAGALTVSLSTFFQAPEISWGVRHLDIDTLIVSARYLKADYVKLLEQALPGLSEQTSTELHLATHPYLRRIIVWGECDRPWALKGASALEAVARSKPRIDDRFLEEIESNIAPADLLVTICTSGTTEYPKAVVHTHGATIRITEKFLSYMNLLPDDRTYPAMPFFWIGGLNSTLLPALFVGSAICFSTSPKPADIVSVIKKERVTRFDGWPTQMQSVIEQDPDLPSLRQKTKQSGEKIGPVVATGGWLGMTETCGMHSIEPIGMVVPPGKTGAYGRQLPGVERKIINPETGDEVKAGEIGELYVRGFSLMNGYYKREREESLQPDGFFATGDLAAIDRDGFLFFHGRRTEMIKTSGANVSPREVEVALRACKGVREAIVFGRPDQAKGEAVTAVVVPSAGAVLEPAELTGKLRALISIYKVPDMIVIMSADDVPRTATNKALKKELLTMLLSKAGAE